MSRLPPLRISTFIYLSHFLIGVIGVGTLSIFTLFTIYTTGEQSLKRQAEDTAFVIGKALEQPLETLHTHAIPAQTRVEIHQIVTAHLLRQPGAQYTIFAADGMRLLSGKPDALTAPQPGFSVGKLPPEVITALSQTIGSDIREDEDGVRQIYAAVEIEHNQQVYAVLQIILPYAPAMGPTYHTLLIVALFGLLIIILILLIGLQGSSYLTRPIVALSQVAEQLGKGNLTVRAKPDGPREVIHLAETLNNMASRQQASLNSMQTFVANASHELRTPLTGIKLQVGALRSGAMGEPEVAARFLSQVEDEIDRMIQMVNDLLDLSNIQGAGLTNMQPIDMFDLVSEVKSFWEVRSQAAAIQLSLDASSGLPDIQGDPFRLRRVLDNLLDNAIKFTPAGGKVQIRLGMAASPGFLRLEVQDSGVGISKENLLHLFERFYRVNPGKAANPANASQRPGSGLGLAIAQSIILAHSGRIGVDTQSGEGSCFWVELPVISGK